MEECYMCGCPVEEYAKESDKILLCIACKIKERGVVCPNCSKVTIPRSNLTRKCFHCKKTYHSCKKKLEKGSYLLCEACSGTMAHFPIERIEKMLTSDPHCSKLALLYGVDDIPLLPPDDDLECVSEEENILSQNTTCSCIIF